MNIVTEPDLSIDKDGRLLVMNGHFDFNDEPLPRDTTCFDLVSAWAIEEANRRLEAK